MAAQVPVKEAVPTRTPLLFDTPSSRAALPPDAASAAFKRTVPWMSRVPRTATLPPTAPAPVTVNVPAPNTRTVVPAAANVEVAAVKANEPDSDVVLHARSEDNTQTGHMWESGRNMEEPIDHTRH
jgi:hypothetical protein